MTGRDTDLLQGLRVLELSQGVAAAYAGKLLASLGAAVSRAPLPAKPGAGLSEALADYLHTGKGRTDAYAPGAFDIVLTDVHVDARAALGIDLDGWRKAEPALITGAASVFGDTGADAHAPAVELDAYAKSGVAWVIGEPGRPPLIVPFHHAEMQAGAHLAAAALMALIARRRSGRGQAIDIAAADVVSAAVGVNGMLYLYEILQRYDRAGRRAFASGGPYPYVLLPCADGEVCLVGRARHEWGRLMAAMGDPEWSKNPRYQDLRAMGRDYPEEVDALIQPWLSKHTRAELLALAEQHGFPIGPVYRMEETVGLAQFAYRGFFAERDGRRMPEVPWTLTRGAAA